MIVYKKDAIKFTAIMFRVRGNTYKRVVRDGYGYIVDILEGTRFVAVYNGIDTFLVDSSDIVQNFGQILLVHKNDLIDV